MADLLTIIDLLISNADNISIFLIVGSLIIALSISVYEYKERLVKYVTNKRNKWWFVYLFAMLALVLYFERKNIIRGGWRIVVSIIWGMYAIVCFLELTPKDFGNFSNHILRKYEKKLKSGAALENIDYFKNHHWYLFTSEDKVEYEMLKSMYYVEINDNDNAYQVLSGINQDCLYEIEKKRIENYRASLLVMMGDMTAALHILGDPQINQSNDPLVWLAYSLIFENAGDIEKAYEYSTKSKSICETDGKNVNIKAGEIYNNYSRIALLNGNRDEALRYINLAWQKVKETQDYRIIPTIASNRILQMAIAGKTKEECDEALREYKDTLPASTIKSRIEYANCEVAYCRQIGNEKRAEKLIKSVFNEIIDKLDDTQREVFIVSNFRMLMNGHYNHKWFDKYVKSDYKNYEKLPIVERIAVFKEYMGIFEQEEFRSLQNKKTYKALKQTIGYYYKTDAIKDIERKLAEIESYNVHLYHTLVSSKLAILKFIDGKNHIEKDKKTYLNLYKELYDKGLHIDAVNVLMTLVDECKSPYNMMVWNPIVYAMTRPVYYCDLLEMLPPTPDPTLDKDGIHLNYFRVSLPPYTKVVPTKADVIEEYIDLIINEFNSWKNHPFKLDLSIQIAHILMCLGRRDEAKDFYRFFIESGVSPRQFASWVNDDIAMLGMEFNDEIGYVEEK